MKRVPLFLLLCLLCMIQNGCFLKSVHPLVSDEEAILVEGLEGIWESEDHRWTFINDFEKFPNLHEYIGEKTTVDFEGDMYMILIQDLTDTIATAINEMYVGKIINLNNAFFLDISVFLTSIDPIKIPSSINLYGEFHEFSVNSIKITSDSGTIKNGEFIDNHFFPVHTFSKISIHDNQLDIEFFKSSFISDLISSNRIRIKHEKTDDSILITASTSELKKFVEKYAHETEAFEKPLELSFKGFVHE